MHTGVVKRFDAAKGYGWIAQDGDDTRDAFVHYSAICGDGYKTLTAGDRVEYEVRRGPKGLLAYAVRVLEPAEAA
ncbi:MAG: cold-shock protein [Bryobacteraceae bacterium]